MAKHVVKIDGQGIVKERYFPILPRERKFSEAFLQKLIFEEPKLLPTEEIGFEYSKLIPLARASISTFKPRDPILF